MYQKNKDIEKKINQMCVFFLFEQAISAHEENIYRQVARCSFSSLSFASFMNRVHHLKKPTDS